MCGQAVGMAIDVAFERCRPRDVICKRYAIAVSLQRGKELVEAEPRVASHVRNTHGTAIEGACNHNTRDVVHGHHVDGVVDVWPCLELYTAFQHSNEEVVRISSP